MNTGVQTPLQDNDFLSFEDTPSREIAESFDKSIFNFLRNHIVFIVAESIYIQINIV